MSTGEEVLLITLSAPNDYVKERYAEVVYQKWTSFHANYGCSFEELPKSEKLKYVGLLMALYDWLCDMQQED